MVFVNTIRTNRQN